MAWHRLVQVLAVVLTVISTHHAAVLTWQGNQGVEKPRHMEYKLREVVSMQQQEQQEEEEETEAVESRINVKCDVCIAVVTVIQDLVESNASKEEIAEGVAKVCIDLKEGDARVCNGITHVFKEEVVSVFAELVLSRDEVCGLVVGGDCGTPYWPLHDWNVTLPHTPKPPVTPHHNPKAGSPTLRVLQLSDIHIDLLYQPGTNAQCGEPLCCREGKPVADGAGYWGDYRGCDTPPWTLQQLFQHLRDNHTFDYILWTGDLPGHDVWAQTRDDQLRLLDYLADMLDKYFPDTPVFSALGNHESAPVNSFPPPYVTGNDSAHWLYERLAEDWTRWLPRDTRVNINRGAFYTVLLRPGFRLISVNSNFCNNMNFWLYLNTTDPAGHLQWLVTTLQRAEDQKEKVHIIAHIPPGDSSCLKTWSWNYHRIVNRYESTIAAQFFGHTHHDSVAVFYDPPAEATTGRPTSVAFVAPSVTTYSGLNPAYRVYELDGFYNGSSWSVLDHETFILNLTAANLDHHNATWQREYSAKEAYGLSSVFPRDWNSLVKTMERNDTMLQQYYRHYYHSHPPAPLCDATCRKHLLCDAISARSHDPHVCSHLNLTRAQHEAWMEERRLC